MQESKVVRAGKHKLTFEIEIDISTKFGALCALLGIKPREMAQLSLYIAMHLSPDTRGAAFRSMRARQPIHVTIRPSGDKPASDDLAEVERLAQEITEQPGRRKPRFK